MNCGVVPCLTCMKKNCGAAHKDVGIVIVSCCHGLHEDRRRNLRRELLWTKAGLVCSLEQIRIVTVEGRVVGVVGRGLEVDRGGLDVAFITCNGSYPRYRQL